MPHDCAKVRLRNFPRRYTAAVVLIASWFERRRMRDGVTGSRPSGRSAFVGALLASCALCLPLLARAETAVVEAARDATLIEDAEGAFANGSGPYLFSGRTNASTGSLRRALLAFDVAAALPAGAWITGAELELELEPSNPVAIDLGLHWVRAPWSEGPSRASGGGGAPAEPGDATWLHTHYDTEFWDEPGGDFAPNPSAVTSVSDAGLYVWGSTPGLVADVQAWLDAPESNHGWILVGGEEGRQTAKSFASRESPNEVSRPRLVVEYATSCEDFDLGPGALGLCRAYCEALACAGADPHGSARACSRLARAFARRTGGMPPPCEPPQGDAGAAANAPPTAR